MRSELQQRVVSGVILAAAVLFFTWWSFWSFAAICAVGAVILAKEWWTLTKGRSHWFILLGVVYIGGAMASLIILRYVGWQIVLLLLALVWTGDIAAYLVGRKIGKHKIAPSISPGKSWEGLAASICASSLICIVLEATSSSLSNIVIGTTISVVGLFGDLFESHLKRRAGVKDSGTLIPGHGGLFDRMDALMPCAIATAATVYWYLNTFPIT